MKEDKIYKLIKIFIEGNKLTATDHNDIKVHRIPDISKMIEKIGFKMCDVIYLEEKGLLKKLLYNEYVTTHGGEKFYNDYDNSCKGRIERELDKYPRLYLIVTTLVLGTVGTSLMNLIYNVYLCSQK